MPPWCCAAWTPDRGTELLDPMTDPGHPPELQPRRRRPFLLGLLAVAAAASFWILGPPRLPGSPPTEEVTEAPTEPTPSLGTGGFSDGSGSQKTAPPSRAPRVSSAAAEDGVLRLLVVGDDQAGAWAAAAASVLQTRLAASSPPWRGVRVDATVMAQPGWTAAHVLAHLQGGGWADDQPELIVVAVGWSDATSTTAPEVVSRVDGSTTWLSELALQTAAPGSTFYLQPRSGALTALRHLEYLDSIGIEAAARSVAVVYLEQPIHHPVGERRVFPSTAMRPQPWISTVFGLESQPDADSLFDGEQPHLLSERGAEILGRFVGVGLVHVVVGD